MRVPKPLDPIEVLNKANLGIPLTQHETAFMVGVCQTRVSELERSALRKLRKALRKQEKEP